jgi:uncharacterized membrane protein (UPF0127 family)
MDRRVLVAAFGVVVALSLGVAAVNAGLIPWLGSPGEYERVTVTLADANGTDLATVEARVADTPRKLYVGLSDTDSLAAGEGMLFVHSDSGPHEYVMRDMAFPLDIVFVAGNGTVTTIHHAPTEDGGDLTRYPGRGRYVLEVPRGYTNATGLDEGDTVTVPESV